MKVHKVSLWGKLAYGLGNLGYGASFQVLSTYALFFATEVLGISGAVAGAIIGVGTVIDALIDPMIGHVSDITRSRVFGRRHAYLLFGGIGMAICIALFWQVPWLSSPASPWSITARTVWFAVWLLLFRLLSTVYAMPYNALSAELCEDYNERTALQGYKTAFFVVGLLFPSVVVMTVFFKATPLFPQGQYNPQAYPPMGLLLGGMALVFSLICFIATFKYIPFLPKAHAQNKEKGYLRRLVTSLLAALKNKDYRHVAFGYLFVNIAAALVAGLGIYVMTYAFKMNNLEIALVFGSTFVLAVLSQPLWWALSKKMDKKPAMLAAMAATVLGMLYLMVILFFREDVVGKPYVFIPFMLLAGVGVGGVLTMPSSMVADTIDKTELETGQRTDGTFFGTLTFLYKLSQAVAMILIGLLIDTIRVGSKVEHTSPALGLGLVLCIGSIVALGIGALIIRGYTLTRKQVEDIQTRLTERRKAEKENDPGHMENL